MSDDEHREEIFQLIKGSPQPELSITGLAERTGLTDAEAGRLVEEMIAEGRLRREGDRLLAIEG